MNARNKFYFFTSRDPEVIAQKNKVADLAVAHGFEVVENSEDADIIASIGGDGAFLQSVRKTNFRQDAIYVGISTSDQKYLYSDFHIDDTSNLRAAVKNETTEVRRYPVLEINLNNEMTYYCLNDFYIKSSIIKSMTMNVTIDDTHFETFRGDGLLISTPTGSTGYNKSLGGAVVDPKLKSMQMTEIASLNNNNYRTLGSPVVLSDQRELTLRLDKSGNYYPIMGLDNEALSIQYTDFISVKISEKVIKTLKIKENSFWHKVRRNFL
ncbi:NAD kinase [Macrococcus lamae]|uniref:NAD kinase n=1 Tax=Macrococcus lamae TaxID=198484 RepID=A0A4R6BU88_9STAP|nr:NAD kinase [Macrococcus lamae]TDM10596.1 NAD kinase [Macrococcus lamae]